MKWIWVILLVVIGGFFTYMAVEYLTVSLSHIPTWFPGHKTPLAGHRVVHGHYRKGGAAAALLALLAFVGAGFLAFRFANESSGPASPSAPATGATNAGVA
ncbi:MAG: hypothetical protein JO368_01875 [Acidimicrobiales bacterium]|nr:hypothetical protein [Acidimicrobiales bacterium]